MEIYNMPAVTNFKGTVDNNVIAAVKRAKARKISDIRDNTKITRACAEKEIQAINAKANDIILQLTEILRKYSPDTVLQMTYDNKRVGYMSNLKKWIGMHSYELFGHINTYEEIEELYKPEELVLVNEKYGFKQLIKSAQIFKLEDFNSVIDLIQSKKSVYETNIETSKNKAKELIDKNIDVIKNNIEKLNLKNKSENIKDVSRIKIIIWERKTYNKILKQIKTIEKSAETLGITVKLDMLYSELKAVHRENVTSYSLLK